MQKISDLIKSPLTKAIKVYVGQSNHSLQNEAECKIMLSWYRRMASGANPGTGQHKLFHLLFLLFYFSVEKTKFPVGLHSLYTTQPNLLTIFPSYSDGHSVQNCQCFFYVSLHLSAELALQLSDRLVLHPIANWSST